MSDACYIVCLYCARLTCGSVEEEHVAELMTWHLLLATSYPKPPLTSPALEPASCLMHHPSLAEQSLRALATMSYEWGIAA